jgi:hypothetical protein
MQNSDVWMASFPLALGMGQERYKKIAGCLMIEQKFGTITYQFLEESDRVTARVIWRDIQFYQEFEQRMKKGGVRFVRLGELPQLGTSYDSELNDI